MADRVFLRALVSFNGIVKGETAWVEYVPMIRGWERAGWVEVSDGPGEDRSSGPAQSDQGRVDAGAPQGGADGGEPGEDPRSG
jgi:hypothetical protein